MFASHCKRLNWDRHSTLQQHLGAQGVRMPFNVAGTFFNALFVYYCARLIRLWALQCHACGSRPVFPGESGEARCDSIVCWSGRRRRRKRGHPRHGRKVPTCAQSRTGLSPSVEVNEWRLNWHALQHPPKAPKTAVYAFQQMDPLCRLKPYTCCTTFWNGNWSGWRVLASLMTSVSSVLHCPKN